MTDAYSMENSDQLFENIWFKLITPKYIGTKVVHFGLFLTIHGFG